MRTALVAALAVLALTAPATASVRLVEQELPKVLPTERFGGVRFYFGDQPSPAAKQTLGALDIGPVTNDRAGELNIMIGRQTACADVLAAALIDMAAEARRRGADAIVAVRSPLSRATSPHYVCATAFGNEHGSSVTLTGTAVRLN